MGRKPVLLILVLVILLTCKSDIFTPASAATVLAEVLNGSEACRSTAGLQEVDHTISFACSNSADTFYMVSMTRYDRQEEAQTQFDMNRGDAPLLCFHGYNQYETYSTGTGNQFIVGEQTGWQAGQWAVSIQASYDYRYFHFTSNDFSEAVYASAVKHDLFPAGTCP